jgi:lipid-binding SYLF domain-containing protein
LKSAIYSYSRSKGLFAGIALDGAVLQLDDSANKKSGAAVVAPFRGALEKYSSGAPQR